MSPEKTSSKKNAERKKLFSWDALWSTLLVSLFSLAFLFVLEAINFQPLRELDDTATIVVDNILANRKSEKSPPFVFVKIDDTTVSGWQHKFPLPRDELKKLIANISQGDPAMIVLDVLIDTPAAGDDQLVAYLETYGNDKELQKKKVPPLILIRSTMPGPDRPASDTTCSRQNPARQQSTSRLDRPSEVIDDSALSAHVVYGTLPFYQGADRRVQCWALWETIRSPDEQEHQYLSVPMLAALLWAQRNETLPNPDCLWRSGSACENQCASGDASIATNRYCGADRVQPLLYRIPYDIGKKRRPTVPNPTASGAPVPHMMVLSASMVEDLVRTSIFTQRIVVVGASYEDSGDWFETALGTMPGAMMLVNAIDQLVRKQGAMEAAHWGWTAVVWAIAAVGLSILVAFQPIGDVFAGVIMALILLVAAGFLQGSGFLVPFTVPALVGGLNAFFRESRDLAKFISSRVKTRVARSEK